MPGTRLRVLSRLMDWAKSDSMRIFWLAGLAGTGKTSIAITLCRMLQDEPSLVLGGTFFCSRTANIIELTDVRCVLPTLAASLAEKSSSFGDALAKQLNNDSRAALKPISSQIVSLLEEPLAVLASSSYPIVFVVDALDECSDETEVKKFLQAISTLKCSAIVKFVLTSRHPRHRITKVAKGAVAEDFVGCKHRSGDWNTRRDVRLGIDSGIQYSPDRHRGTRGDKTGVSLHPGGTCSVVCPRSRRVASLRGHRPSRVTETTSSSCSRAR